MQAMGCSKSAQKPMWITMLPDNDYFYQAVGVASSQGSAEENWKSAEQNALSALAAQIEIKINQVLTGIIDRRVESDVETLTSSFKRVTKSVVKQTLPDSKIIARYYDKKTGEYWVLAAIEKSVVKKLMIERVQKAKKLVFDHYQAALKRLRDGEISATIREYADAIAAASEDYMQFVKVDLNEDGQAVYPAPQIQREINDIIDKIDILILSGDNQAGACGGGLKEPLVVKVFYKDGDKEIPFSNAPVSFEFVKGSGSLEHNVTTDERGIAESKVYRIDFILENNIVESMLNLEESGLALKKPKSQRFTFKSYSPKEKISIAVKLIEESLGEQVTESIVENKISQKLVEDNYKLESIEIDNAQIDMLLQGGASIERLKPDIDILVIGKVSTAFESEGLGYFISCNARATIKAIDISTGDVILALEITKVRGFGKTKEKASVSALAEAATKIAEDVASGLDKYVLKKALGL
jgi:hypothetical protein